MKPATMDISADEQHEACAVARCAEIVSGKWTLLIVRDLASGAKSYSDLERSLTGISPRTLCERLRQLGAADLVSRTRIKALPPRSMYELTERGRALIPLVDAMRSVGTALNSMPPAPAAPADGVAADASCCVADND